jgi:hypothetical protein
MKNDTFYDANNFVVGTFGFEISVFLIPTLKKRFGHIIIFLQTFGQMHTNKLYFLFLVRDHQVVKIVLALRSGPSIQYVK